MSAAPVWIVTEDFDDKMKINGVYTSLKAAQRYRTDDGADEWRPTGEEDQYQLYTHGEPSIYTVSKWNPET